MPSLVEFVDAHTSPRPEQAWHPSLEPLFVEPYIPPHVEEIISRLRYPEKELRAMASLQAVIVGTKSDSHKYAYANALFGNVRGDIPVLAARFHDIEEEVYHSGIPPALIACIKILPKASKDHWAMLRNRLGFDLRISKGVEKRAPLSNRLKEEAKRLDSIAENSLYMATDVQFQMGSSLQGSRTFNKFHPDVSNEQILKMYMDEFSRPFEQHATNSLFFFEACCIVGFACYHFSNRRGAAGEVITHCLLRPFTPDEISLYVYGLSGAVEHGYPGAIGVAERLIREGHVHEQEYSLLLNGIDDLLYRTPWGWSWEHPIIRSKVQAIEGIWRGDSNFHHAYDLMLLRSLGVPPELIFCIEQVLDPKRKIPHGHLNAINSVIKSHPELQHGLVIGQWEEASQRPISMNMYIDPEGI